MSDGPDVVILGAGIVGCATAYYLAGEGARVVIVERDAVGCGASGLAVGLLNPLTGTGIPGPMAPMAEAAFKMHRALWPRIEEESEVDIQARIMPHLQLCFTEEDVRARRAEMARWAGVDGFSAEWLRTEDVLALEPHVSSKVLGAVLLEEIGLVDSYQMTLALLRAAERRGAALVHGEAAGLETKGGRVTGVRIQQGVIGCDVAVIALGPWSGLASRWLGIDVPVEPLKGQIIHLEGPAEPLRHHMAGPGQVVHKADGHVWLAATEERAGFDLGATRQARDTLMERGVMMVPGLRDLPLVRQTVCLRPIAPDRLPILGRAPGWEGVYLATGAEKKGILLAPAMGLAVADLVLKGGTSLPIAQLAPERFAT